jgi:hypothetical protein
MNGSEPARLDELGLLLAAALLGAGLDFFE